jgi:hypothetical protein
MLQCTFFGKDTQEVMRVREALPGLLADDHSRLVFGQLPDVLENGWIEVAQGRIEEAKQIINSLPAKHPFHFSYVIS